MDGIDTGSDNYLLPAHGVAGSHVQPRAVLLCAAVKFYQQAQQQGRRKKGRTVMYGLLPARKRTRTSMGLPPLDPEPSVSTNFTTRAVFNIKTFFLIACQFIVLILVVMLFN
jgi:hypothetical protein